jgi:hypothetical protein
MEKNEQELMLEALKRLHHNDDFIVWRDKVAKPLIAQWERELEKSDQLQDVIIRTNLNVLNTLKSLFNKWFAEPKEKEVKLRSKIKLVNTLKALFYTWFENIEAQETAQKDTNKEIAT